MNITPEQKKKIVQLFLQAFFTLALGLAAIFGYNSLTPAPQPIESLGLQPIRHNNPETFSQGVTFNGAVVATVIRINSTPVVPFATPQSTATAQPTATQVPFIIRGGTQASYTSGSTITHTFSSAPTWCLVFPNQSITATLTIGAATFSTDMATTASPIYWECGKAP